MEIAVVSSKDLDNTHGHNTMHVRDGKDSIKRDIFLKRDVLSWAGIVLLLQATPNNQEPSNDSDPTLRPQIWYYGHMSSLDNCP